MACHHTQKRSEASAVDNVGTRVPWILPWMEMVLSATPLVLSLTHLLSPSVDGGVLNLVYVVEIKWR